MDGRRRVGATQLNGGGGGGAGGSVPECVMEALRAAAEACGDLPGGGSRFRDPIP